MNGVTKQLVNQIAIALNATNNPVMKDGVSYRILVFKEKDIERWVLALLPDIIPVEELCEAVNDSYGMFLEGAITPCGIVFLYAEQPQLLIELAEEWIYNTIPNLVACL